MSEHEPLYETPAARAHALHTGMWFFLGSETLLFAGLFGLYTAFRTENEALFHVAVRHNNMWIGTGNTLILITSSFFVAWAIHMLRDNRRRVAMLSIGAAMVLGLAFLTLKGIEYAQHLHEGIAPGAYYSSTELPERGARMFFTLYYAMTFLHALHVIGGLCVLGWLVTRIKRRIATAEHHTEVELGGLYWHLVDIVWIFLWPLLYLAG